MPISKQAWFISTNDQNTYNHWKSEGFISFSHPELGDLSSLRDYAQFKDHYRDLHLGATVAETNIISKQVYSFVQEMQVGDYIIANLSSGDKYLIGVVEGEYKYEKGHISPLKHLRNVSWMSSEHLINASQPLRSALKNNLRLFPVHRHWSEIQQLANKKEQSILQNNVKVSNHRDLKYWGTIVALTAGILTIIVTVITFLPTLIGVRDDLVREFRNPANHLILENYYSYLYSQRYDFIVLTEDLNLMEVNRTGYHTNRCRTRTPENCTAFLYLGALYRPFLLDITVSSDVKTSPMTIDGIEVALVGFESLGSEHLNMLLDVTGAMGGGRPASRFYLGNFDGRNFSGLPFDYELVNPERAIGSRAIGKLDCGEERICNDLLYLQPNEVEKLSLEMAFVEYLPPGWYEFEAAITYSFQGEQFTSNDKVFFDIIKPNNVRLWTKDLENDFLIPAPFEVSMSTGQYLPTYNPLSTENNRGFLTFQSGFGLDSNYIVWDLQSGEIQPVGHLDLIPQFTFNTDRSSDGWLMAGETRIPIISSRMSAPSDLLIVDLKTGSRFIRNTPLIHEMDPIFSPSGRQVAFVSYAIEDTTDLARGEADIYILDLQSQEVHRVTHTPTVIEASPVWISEKQLAFLVPSLKDDDFDLDLPTNIQTGIGTINLETQDSRFIYIDSISEEGLIYLDSLQRLAFKLTDLPSAISALPDIYLSTLDGKSIERLPDRDAYSRFGYLDTHGNYGCHFLNTQPLKRLCVGSEDITIYDETTNAPIKLLDRINSTDIHIGTVATGGFIIINVRESFIYQYDENGQFVQEWLLPAANEILAWGASDITLIP